MNKRIDCNCEAHKSIRPDVDPSNAPKGFIAQFSSHYEGSCIGCAFFPDKCCKKKKCMRTERADRRDVVFVKK